MIEVKQVEKSYGKKVVLDKVDFSAKKGEVTCLIGENGSGKTTLLNAIMGLTPIDGGEILINGKPRSKETYEIVAYIPDTLTMLPSMTIEESFQFMKDFYKNWNGYRAEEILEFFKLSRKEKIANLSKGNKMKTNLLLGLALDADFLLMDEPFSGIDLLSREQINEVFASHLIENRGVIITTHELDEIEFLVDYAVILQEGRVVKDFYTEEVREKEGKSIVDMMREVLKK